MKIHTIYDHHPSIEAHFKSSAEVREARKLHLIKYHNVIHPLSLVCFIWQSFISFVLFISFIIIPTLFVRYLEFNEKGEMISTIPNLSEIVALNIIFFIEMYMKLHMGVSIWESNKHQRKIVLDVREYVPLYLKTTFTFDFLTTIPNLMAAFFIYQHDVIVVAHFLTILKFMRIREFCYYVKNLCRYAKCDETTIDVIIIAILGIIICNFLTPLQLLPGIVEAHVSDTHIGSYWYVNEFKSGNTTKATQYFVCLYRSVSALLGNRFMRFKSAGYIDNSYISCALILGCLLKYFLMSLIHQKLLAPSFSVMKYGEMMNQLDSFMTHKELPAEMKSKIKKLHDYYYQKSFYDERSIITTIPDTLKKDVMLHNVRALLEHTPFFKNIPSSLFLKIFSRFEWEIVEEGDTLYATGEESNCMYFLISGQLVLYSPSNIEVEHLEDGMFVGEIGMVMTGETRISTVKAISMCELYRLDQEDFDEVIAPYPNLLTEIESVAIQRYNKVRAVEQQFRRHQTDGHDQWDGAYFNSTYDGLSPISRRGSSSGGSYGGSARNSF